MSREKVRHYEWHRPRFSRHAFLEIEPGAGNMRIFGVHLSALYSAWTERHRVIELRALLAAIAHHQHGFHVLTGDFNTLAPGDLLDFRKLPHRLRALVWLSGGRIRWRTIQIVLDAGYVDVYRALNGADVGYTFPTWAPHVRLDYMFVPSGFAGRVSACEDRSIIRLRPPPRDHFPLLAEDRRADPAASEASRPYDERQRAAFTVRSLGRGRAVPARGTPESLTLRSLHDRASTYTVAARGRDVRLRAARFRR